MHEQNAEQLPLIPVHVQGGAVYTSVRPRQCVCAFSASKQGISLNRTDELFFALAGQQELAFCVLFRWMVFGAINQIGLARKTVRPGASVQLV